MRIDKGQKQRRKEKEGKEERKKAEKSKRVVLQVKLGSKMTGSLRLAQLSPPGSGATCDDVVQAPSCLN